MDPETLDFDQSRQLIRDANATLLPGAQDFYEGRQFGPNGEDWVGPQFNSADAVSLQVMEEIKKVFTPQNITAEVVDRDVRGVLGKEPAWGLTIKRALKEGEEPTTEEQALIDEAEALATTWFDSRQGFQSLNGILQECSIHRVLKNAATRYRISGRGPLRFVIPPGARDELTGKVRTLKPDEVHKYIHFDAPSLDTATVALDSETLRSVGVFLGELQEREQIQLCYLDSAGKTILRTIEGNTLDTASTSGIWVPTSAVLRARTEANLRAGVAMPYDLGGNLTMLQMSGQAMIDEIFLRINRQINKVCTITGRNLDVAGFIDEIIFNADAFEEVDDPKRPGEKLIVSKVKAKGPGITNYLIGAVSEDPDTGKLSYANPSRDRAQPVDSDPLINVAMFLYRCALQSKNQLHAFLSGDAVTSGEARKQALTDYIISLMDPKEVVEWALRWAIETYLAWVGVLTGKPGRYASLRATADCRLYAGPMSSEEQKVIMLAAEKKIVSVSSARSQGFGIDDVDAEGQVITTEAAHMPRGDLEQAQLFDVYVQTFDAATSAELAGLSKDKLAIIQKAGVSPDDGDQ
jgi:hypothetical protein